MTRPVQAADIFRDVQDHTRRISNLERKRPDQGPLSLPEVSGTLSTDFLVATYNLEDEPAGFANVPGIMSSSSGTSITMPSDQVEIQDEGLYVGQLYLTVTPNTGGLTEVATFVVGPAGGNLQDHLLLSSAIIEGFNGVIAFSARTLLGTPIELTVSAYAQGATFDASGYIEIYRVGD